MRALRGIAIEAITDPYKPCEQFRSLENYALLGYYAGSSGNLLQTFRDNLSVPSQGSTDPCRWERKVVPERP